MSQITIAAASDLGQKRKENQDSHTFHIPAGGSSHKKGILMALADGMGGHSGGSIASQTATAALQETYYAFPGDIREALEQGFLEANRQVIQKGKDDIALQGLGSTMVAVVFKEDRMYFANVGDSRGYLVFDHQMTQFTEDHSYVASLLKAGVINEEEAENHPEGNVITRAIGAKDDLDVDVCQEHIPLEQGQYVLICCDGLYREVTGKDIVDTIYDLKEPELICEKLIEKANANGGHDNITVLIARIDSTGSALQNMMNRLRNFLR